MVIDLNWFTTQHGRKDYYFLPIGYILLSHLSDINYAKYLAYMYAKSYKEGIWMRASILRL